MRFKPLQMKHLHSKSVIRALSCESRVSGRTVVLCDLRKMFPKLHQDSTEVIL